MIKTFVDFIKSSAFAWIILLIAALLLALPGQLVSDAVTTATKTGRAKALQTAMLKMIDNGLLPRWSHPTFWAPFILVGEGAN